MKFRIMLLAAAAVFVFSVTRAEGPAKTDRDLLQGTWRLAAVELNKQAIPLETLKEGNVVVPGILVIKGDSYSFHLGTNRLEMTFKLDPDKKPKTIDMTIIEGTPKGKTYHAIYKLEGDTYTVCRQFEPEKDRPAEFGTKADSGLLLVVWKRDKSASAPKPEK